MPTFHFLFRVGLLWGAGSEKEKNKVRSLNHIHLVNQTMPWRCDRPSMTNLVLQFSGTICHNHEEEANVQSQHTDGSELLFLVT